jgi:hypothetical protein
MKVLITNLEYPDIELERSVLESVGGGVELVQGIVELVLHGSSEVLG